MKGISRGQFLKCLLGSAIFLPGVAGLGASMDQLRGDRVGWARLKTPSEHWNRHSGSDPVLMHFFRDETTLNIDPTWYAADCISLGNLCKYPFLFSQGVGMVSDPIARENIAEYIRRGGFLLLDACCNPAVTPDFDRFIREHTDFFSAVLPEAQVVKLPPSHEVYRCHFQIPDGRPPHTYMGGVFDARKAEYGLFGVMIDKRMVSLISVCGWQCGWDEVTASHGIGPPGHSRACMRMLVNVYIHAMMQGA